jgi:predicted GNAT family acetyltransferase
MRLPSPEAYRSLAEALQPEGGAGLLFDAAPDIPADWTVSRSMAISQMIADSVHAAGHEHRFVELGEANVAEMLALCELAKPGPFGPRTYELGTYLGIRVGGDLVAMAGERLRLTGFTELSAVCTHPDHRGRGYAQVLVAELARRILEREEMPFLHVRTDNADAIHVYEKLGFRLRRLIHLAIVHTRLTAGTQPPRAPGFAH